MSLRTIKDIVAPRKRACSVCRDLTAEAAAEVNAAIWPEPGVAVRARDYRVAGQRAALAQGLDVEAKTITRHADHIEASWREPTPKKPAGPREPRVFPTDFQSITTFAVEKGMEALERIGERIPEMDDRDLISVARMGQSASTQREALRLRQQETETAQGLLAAMFGLGAGLLSDADIPEAEVIDVTPHESVEEMLDGVRSERAALVRLQQGELAPGG